MKPLLDLEDLSASRLKADALKLSTVSVQICLFVFVSEKRAVSAGGYKQGKVLHWQRPLPKVFPV